MVMHKWLNIDTYWDIDVRDPAETEAEQHTRVPPRPAPEAKINSYPNELKQKFPLIDPTGKPYRSRLHDPRMEDLSVRTLLEQLVIELRATVGQPWGRAQGLIDQITSISAKLQESVSTDPLQIVEAQLEFGCVYWRTRQLSWAFEMFEKCARAFHGADLHAEAVARWMAGYALFQMPNPDVDRAVVFWQAGWQHFAQCAQENRRPKTEMRWYQQRADLMLTDLQNALAQGGFVVPAAPPAPDASPAHSPANGGSAPAPEPTPSPLNEFSEKAMLRFKGIAIYEAVSARPSGGPLTSQTEELAATDYLYIESYPYCFLSLKKRPVINLDLGGPEPKHLLVKVIGASMDRSQPHPINEGDYALTRVNPNPPNGAVVVAEIEEPQSGEYLAIVKRKEDDGLYSDSSTKREVVNLRRVRRYIGEVIAIGKRQSA
jgi:hypothetical protein